MSNDPVRFIATLEPVSSCPVNCTTCPVSRRDIAQPKARLMDEPVAAAVAARLRHEFDVQYVWWGNWGEPLVHPGIGDLAAAMRRVGVEHQILSSSLSVKFDVEGLVTSSISQLDVSISGMTAEVYNLAHRDGKWDLVRRNLDDVALRAEKHPGALQVDVRWHRYRHNEHQLEEARRFAEERGFGFKPYYAHIGGVDALRDLADGTLPEERRNFFQDHVFMDVIRRISGRHVGATSCSMDRNLVIHSDGRLLHCCARMASHPEGVDFLTLSRDAVLAFKGAGNPDCARCLAQGWSGYTTSGKTDADLEAAPSLAPAPANVHSLAERVRRATGPRNDGHAA